MIGNASSNRRGGFQGRVNSGKIVVHHVERHGGGVVLDLLRERVRKPSEPAHTHAYREVLSFDVAGRNVFRVWISDNANFFAAGADSQAVSLLAFRLVAIILHEPCIVHVFAECLHDGIQVRCQPVRSKLHAIRKAGRHIGNEYVSSLGIALAKDPARNELRIGIDCRPGPHVASDALFRHVFSHLFLLAVAERPNFIDLNPLTSEIAECSILEFRASRAEFHQQFVDGVAGNARDPSRRAHRIAVHQTPNHHDSLFRTQLVHTKHYA